MRLMPALSTPRPGAGRLRASSRLRGCSSGGGVLVVRYGGRRAPSGFGPRAAGQVAARRRPRTRTWVSSPQPLGPLGLGPFTPEKSARPPRVGGGGQAPRLPGGGKEGGVPRGVSREGVSREGALRARCGPPRKWIWTLRIQPRFQVFSRPGPACSRPSPAPPPPAPSP